MSSTVTVSQIEAIQQRLDLLAVPVDQMSDRQLTNLLHFLWRVEADDKFSDPTEAMIRKGLARHWASVIEAEQTRRATRTPQPAV